MRGGTTVASLDDVNVLSNGLRIPVFNGNGISTQQFTTQGYNAAPSTAGANGYANPQSGGRRRSRKTRRRHRRRSMRGGSDGSRIVVTTQNEPVGGVAVGALVRSGVATGVQPS